MKEIKTILFVCTGNTCRSSMAEALAKRYLEQQGMGDRIKIVSAGTAAWQGSCASPEAVAVLETKGIDLTRHRSQMLTPELAGEADLILTMTRSHKNQVIRMMPSLSERTFTLKEYVLTGTGEPGNLDSPELDIADPFGYGTEIYQDCADELENDVAMALDIFLRDQNKGTMDKQ